MKTRILSILLILFLIFSATILTLLWIVQTPAFQTWITQKVAANLSEQFDTKITVSRVNIEFFTSLSLEDVYVEDRQQDTLFYAGKMRVDLDGFKFFKRELQINRIHLDRAKVNLKRMADQEDFNFAFITDKLSGNEPRTSSDGIAWNVELGFLAFYDTRFFYLDEHTGDLIRVHLPVSAIDIYDFLPSEQVIDLKALHLDRPSVTVKKVEAGSAYLRQIAESIQEEDYIELKSFNPDNWNIFVENTRIRDARFSLVNEMHPPHNQAHIDFNRMHVDQININLGKTEIIGDTILSNVNHLTLRESSGFIIHELSAKARVSPREVICENMILRTPNSHLEHYFAMRYSRFDDFNDFVNKVKMEGRFKNSKLHFRDIDFFAGALKEIAHNSLMLTGNINGTVDNLRGRDLSIQYGHNSFFRGNLSMAGLPELNETFMDFNVIESKVNFEDVKRFYPKTEIPTQVADLGSPLLKGRFTGFYYDFVANGQIDTDLGRLKSDLNLKINLETEAAEYSGALTAERFRLDKWVQNKELFKTISFDLSLNGTGLTYDYLDAVMYGNINSFYFNGYEYKDISVDGRLNQKLFSGALAVSDENIKLDFVGLVNYNLEQPEFNFTAKIDSANLMALNFIKEPFLLSTELSLDARGENFENFSGEAIALNTNFFDGVENLFLEKINLKSVFLTGEEREISLTSDFGNGFIRGEFYPDEFSDAALYFVQSYFYSYLTDFKRPEKTQNIRFNFTLNELDEENQRILYFFPFLKPFEKGTLSGSFNSELLSLELAGFLPRMQWNSVELDSVYFLASSSEEQLEIDLGYRHFLVKDSIVSSDAHLFAYAFSDTVLFNLKVEAVDALNRLDFSGMLETSYDFVSIDLMPSEIVLNDKVWAMNLRSPIILYEDRLLIENLILESGWQSIHVNSFITFDQENNVNVRFRDVQLKDFSNTIGSFLNFEMDGLVNGHLNFSNIFQDPVAYSVLTISNFSLEYELMGNLNLLANYRFNDRLLSFNAGIRDQLNDFALSMNLDFNDATETALDGSIDINRFHLPVIEPFIDEYVSDIEGHTKGKLSLSGSLSKPILTGDLTVHETKTTVNYLQTRYSLDNQKIKFEPYWIDLTGLELKDDFGNTASAGGYLMHNYLQNFVLSVFVNTNNFLFLNTTARDNEQFYGRAFGGGTVLFSGPFDDIVIYISARTNRNTVMNVPVVAMRSVEQYGFFRFIDKENGEEEDDYFVRTNNLSLNLELEVTPDAEIQLIFDRQQGDLIKGRGTGDIRMDINQFGEFQMYGSYEIQQGDYLFTLQNIINKKFLIDQGGTIVWTGDPYEAQLNLSAIYNLRATPYELIRDLLTDNDQLIQARNRTPVNLYLTLSGSLLQPDIAFDIRVPDPPPGITSPIENKLQIIQNDDNELNRQVFGLLVLNRFLPSYALDNTMTAENPLLASGMENTVSEFLSNQFSMYFTDMFSEFVTDIDFNVKYRTYQYEQFGIETPEDFESRRELHLAMTKRFFDDRVSIDVGGNIDFGTGQTTDPDAAERANSIAGDFRLEYSIRPDGRLRVKAFRTSQYDVLIERNRNKTGVGLFYREEFDTMGELWNKLFRRQKEETDEHPAPDELPPAPEGMPPEAIEFRDPNELDIDFAEELELDTD